MTKVPTRPQAQNRVPSSPTPTPTRACGKSTLVGKFGVEQAVCSDHTCSVSSGHQAHALRQDRKARAYNLGSVLVPRGLSVTPNPLFSGQCCCGWGSETHISTLSAGSRVRSADGGARETATVQRDRGPSAWKR